MLIATAIFGAKKLPEIGKELGKGIKEFKKRPFPGQMKKKKPPRPKEIEEEYKDNKKE